MHLFTWTGLEQKPRHNSLASVSDNCSNLVFRQERRDGLFFFSFFLFVPAWVCMCVFPVREKNGSKSQAEECQAYIQYIAKLRRLLSFNMELWCSGSSDGTALARCHHKAVVLLPAFSWFLLSSSPCEAQQCPAMLLFLAPAWEVRKLCIGCVLLFCEPLCPTFP